MGWLERDIKIKEIGQLSSVSVDGNYAITGDGYNGIVKIYKINEKYEWELMVTKTGVGDIHGSAGFGYSVAISGTYAIVGDPMKDDQKGEIIVYEMNNEGEWKNTYSDTGEKEEGRLGWSVSLSGDHAIVGSPHFDHAGTGTNEGKIFFYRKLRTQWAKNTFSPIGENDNDYFGWSVSISGTMAIVGSLQYGTGKLLKSGKVYFYRLYSDGWEQTFVIQGDRKGGNYGSSVSIDGTSAIVGAQRYDTFDDSDRREGKVYFLERHQVGGWINKESFVGEEKEDFYGSSVSINGNYAIVGAPNYDIKAKTSSSEGKIYFYKKAIQWKKNGSFAGDKVWGLLGNSVSIDGTYAITGAPLSSDGNNTVRWYYNFRV